MRKFFTPLALGLLAACGSEPSTSNDTPAEATETAPMASGTAAPTDEGLSDYEVAYKKKVQTKVRNTVVNSLMREYELSQEQAECLIGLGASTYMANKRDEAARSKVQGCNIDPDLVLD